MYNCPVCNELSSFMSPIKQISQGNACIALRLKLMKICKHVIGSIELSICKTRSHIRNITFHFYTQGLQSQSTRAKYFAVLGLTCIDKRSDYGLFMLLMKPKYAVHRPGHGTTRNHILSQFRISYGIRTTKLSRLIRGTEQPNGNKNTIKHDCG